MQAVCCPMPGQPARRPVFPRNSDAIVDGPGSHPPDGPGRTRRRSQSGSAGSEHAERDFFGRHAWPQSFDVRLDLLRIGDVFRPRHLHAAEEYGRAQVDARGFRTDLRNLQNLSGHAGQIPDAARVFIGVIIVFYFGFCRHFSCVQGCRHSVVQRHRHLRQLSAWPGSAFA